jgi:DNA (cytosine-5)-methyltransferase 1
VKAVSLFSGAGGLDLGLRNAGFDIVLANELEQTFCESHSANLPASKIHQGSVTDLTEARLGELLDGVGDIDLLAGGPPCPPYSKSRFYRTEKPRGLDDPVGEETLRGYLNCLNIIRPRAFLLENVAGMSFGVHRAALDYVIKVANSWRYKTDWRVLNAADYGVPQIRQRLFLVGVRKGDFVWPTATHAKNPVDSAPQVMKPWVTAGEAIHDLDTEEYADDRGHFAGGKHHELLKEIPPGQNYLFFTKERGHPNPQFKWRSRYWSFLLKLSPELPSWTIQARRSNNMGPLHWRNRILRIQEVMRLQSFPDDWTLTGTVENQWRQVGNAVPPLLAQHLGRAIHDALSQRPKIGSR